jgi:acyl carrier protein
MSGGALRPIDRLANAFIEALGLLPGTRVETLEYRQVEQWDSVAHMQLIAEIERAFDVMLSTDEVIGLSSFARAREILKEHGVEI